MVKFDRRILNYHIVPTFGSSFDSLSPPPPPSLFPCSIFSFIFFSFYFPFSNHYGLYLHFHHQLYLHFYDLSTFFVTKSIQPTFSFLFFFLRSLSLNNMFFSYILNLTNKTILFFFSFSISLSLCLFLS